ncbi:MAG: prolyl oligopeptidase family serine peptidase [Deltaproteobacteria bacterium]|nr:prolyl oligopeptidase family serine peptidase [Deltaproteobacteria bacterium]
MRLRRGWIFSLLGFFLGCAAISTIPLQSLQVAPAGKPIRFFYPNHNGNVEGYLIRPRGTGPFPLIVLLHGHSMIGEGASRVLPAAEEFSRELCYAALAISLPGYGMTELGADGDREIVESVVLDGIAHVTSLPWVDRERLLVYGFSRGAFFAAALSGKLPNLRTAVLHAGAYDLQRLYEDTPSLWVRQSLSPNGDRSSRLVTILPEVTGWRAPTLILHGGKDQLIPISQASFLRDRLEALGKPHRFVVFPDAGHRLPLDGVKQEVLSFIGQNVGTACSAR